MSSGNSNQPDNPSRRPAVPRSRRSPAPQNGSLSPKTPRTSRANLPSSAPISSTTMRGREPVLSSGRQIVPRRGVPGQALLTVIAIMTFLACITLGGVTMVRQAASSWQSDISREITVQIRPVDGVDMAAAIRSARLLLMENRSVERVSVLDDDETTKLLEPWLGSGVQLDELPIPRLLVVKLAAGTKQDLTQLRQEVEARIPGASLDDHRSWRKRLSAMANTTVIAGLLIFVLVMTATVLTVVFATRGAMAGNRQIIEVLHFVGADGKFIAGEFERHFLRLGLRGAAAGGLGAIIVFILLAIWSANMVATPEGDQMTAMFGQMTLGLWGFVGIVLVCLAIVALAVFTSRMTVINHVGSLEAYGGTGK